MTTSVSSFIDDIRQVQPLQAWRSMRALIAEPERTGEVFKIIQALKGNSLARAIDRLSADPRGLALMRSKPEILALLGNRDALRAMPAGSLGRAYLEFVERQQLSADGLVAASEETSRANGLSPEELWLGNRLRDIHDLQHVMTGYGRDELGELCLLAFMNAQTPNRGIAFIIFMGRRQFRREAPEIAIDDCVAEGRLTGEQAQWFATIDWEQRLSQPLESLRQELGIRTPVLYQQTLARLA
jgi:ubiquinone biosynthesis protein COQ4